MEHRYLSPCLLGRSVYHRHAGRSAIVVDHIARGIVIGTVDHCLRTVQPLGSIGGRQPLGDDFQAAAGIQPRKTRGRSLGFRRPDLGSRVQHLALQIARRHRIALDDPDMSHPGRHEIVQYGRAEPAGPDDRHPAFEQPRLSLLAEAVHQQIAPVALPLSFGYFAHR